MILHDSSGHDNGMAETFSMEPLVIFGCRGPGMEPVSLAVVQGWTWCHGMIDDSEDKLSS